MKKASLVVISILFLFQAQAQRSIAVGLHGNAGNKAFIGNGGYGADLSVLWPVAPNGAIRFHLAYDRFPKAIGLIGSNDDQVISFVPVQIGYQQFLYSDNVFMYGQAGTTSVFYPSNQEVGFSYSFGTGYKLNLPKSKLLQFTISYQRTDQQYAWFGLGVAYGVKYGTRKTFRRDDQQPSVFISIFTPAC